MSLMHDALREMEKTPPAEGLAKPMLTYDTSPATREQDSPRALPQQRPFLDDYAPAGARDYVRRAVPTSGGWVLGTIVCLSLLTCWWLLERSVPTTATETVSTSARVAAATVLTAPGPAVTPPPIMVAEATVPAVAPPVMPAPQAIASGAGIAADPSSPSTLQQTAPVPNVQVPTKATSPQAIANTASPPGPPLVITPPSKPIAVAGIGVQRAVLTSDAEALRDVVARNATAANANRRFSAIAAAIESGDEAEARAQLSRLEQELPATSLTLLRAQAWVLSTASGADVPTVRAAYTAILARLPDDENALLNLSALELKAGRLDVARALVSSALSANPDSVAARAAQQRIGAAVQVAQSVAQPVAQK